MTADPSTLPVPDPQALSGPDSCPRPGSGGGALFGLAPPRLEGLVWRRVFTGTLDQVPQARRFVRFLLKDIACVDVAELVVSELAGNALCHTRSGHPGGWFMVEVVLGAGNGRGDGPADVLITVHDCGGGGIPRLAGPSRTAAEGEDQGGREGEYEDESQGEDQDQGEYEEGGRGLVVVAGVARRTGFQGAAMTGHRVWALLADDTG
ncbi:ATP-binding protein [Sphaerisporangium corydalis]|uniref:ATP-binding protein n=1 Tax=Sphaerisporangium corydalis TaxID=1441875 RepID=A0ABV9ED42_9ACTN|nr:ATP-binding protein [Sphaerisporangium corydalis]